MGWKLLALCLFALVNLVFIIGFAEYTNMGIINYIICCSLIGALIGYLGADGT